jgi:hypothetical protein
MAVAVSNGGAGAVIRTPGHDLNPAFHARLADPDETHLAPWHLSCLARVFAR